LARAVNGLLQDNQADKDNVVDTRELVYEFANEAHSEAVARLVDGQVDQLANKIDYVAGDGGNVESWSVDGDTDGSDDCLAATISPPAMHRCRKSRAGISTSNYSDMSWSIVVCTCSNWVQCFD
jgi:hypothetical protein